MIKLKYIFIISVFAMLISSCAESDFEGTTYPQTAYSEKGAVVTVSDVVTGFYNLQDPASASIGFTVGTNGEAATSIGIFKSFNGGDPVAHATVSTIPSAITIPVSEAAAGLVDVADLKVGDYFTFTFDSQTASGTFPSGTSLRVDVSCPSDFGGTFDYVGSNLAADNATDPCPTGEVTGVVTFEDLGGGQYLVSDLGFGQYESSCWSDGPATSDKAIISDLCNKITTGGLDQYGLTYIWVIKDVSGPSLSLSWTNDYGDRGDAVVTRPDGTDWPQLYTE